MGIFTDKGFKTEQPVQEGVQLTPSQVIAYASAAKDTKIGLHIVDLTGSSDPLVEAERVIRDR